MPDFYEPVGDKIERVSWAVSAQKTQLDGVLKELARLRGWIAGLSWACLVLLALVVIALVS